jgi:hypothetical protein
MTNFPAVSAVRAALDSLRGVGVAVIAAGADPMVEVYLSGLSRLPIEHLSPRSP